MPRYKSLSVDLRWVLVHMRHKRNLSVKEIELQTRVKERVIQKVLKLFEETGNVVAEKEKKIRPGKLDENNIQVSSSIPSLFILSTYN